MIPGIVAAQRRLASGPPASLVGVSATSALLTSTDFTVSVPSGAQAGDTMIAILRCRADRSFAVPPGWVAETDGVTVGTSGTATANTRLYILHKTFGGETSLTFSQSASAAGGAVLVVVRGALGGITKANNATGTSRSPVNSQSMMLAIGTSSGMAAADDNPVWAAPFSPPAIIFRWASSAPYFYGVSVANYSSGGVASVVATYTWPGSSGANYIWLAEILPPS